MKVLQINSVCGIGSTGRIATDINNILTEQGYDGYIAYGRDLPQNCKNTMKIGTKIDNYKHVAMTRLFDIHGFGSKRATIKFIDKIKKLDPDIIHLHNIHGYYINIKVLFDYLKESNKPVVWTLHDCWSFTGHCTYFTYAGCDKWKSGCNNCPEKNAYPRSMFLDNSRNNYKRKKAIFTGVHNLTIVTPSQWLADLIKDSYLKEYEVKIINNGIDLNLFKPIHSTFKVKYSLENKFIILGVANIWDKRKGLSDFVKLSTLIDDNSVIVLVGLNEAQIKNLPPKILGLKKTKNIQELVEIYSVADVFVNPSKEETMGLVTAEALACGIPAIVYDSTAVPEVVDRKSGIVVDTNNILGLSNAINQVRDVKISSVDCINRAKYYSKNERFKEYVNLYIEMIGGTK